MRLILAAEFTPIKAGVEARSPDLKICGYGTNRTTALDSLRVGVRAWVLGLMRADADGLNLILERAGIDYERDGDTVEIEWKEKSRA